MQAEKVIIEYDEVSGARYEGEVNEKGQYHGYGVYTDNVGVGRRYEGQYKNGIRCGYGIDINHKGYKYEGEFMDGLLNGQGTFSFPDGRKYVGEFKDGLLNGQGIFTTPNGNTEVGEWVMGNKK